MRVSSFPFVAAGVAAGLVACTKPAGTAANTTRFPMATVATMPAGPTPGTMAVGTAHVVVLYNVPKDTAAFEKYYAGTHLPLLNANAKEIGYTHAELVKFTTSLDGQAPMYYRKAEMWFSSMAALKKGLATPGFQKVAGDLPNFATGGVVGLIGTE
jgi:uncharacterized protein (TIGR02118 family)